MKKQTRMVKRKKKDVVDEVKFINDTVLVNSDYRKQSKNNIETNIIGVVDNVIFWF